MLNLVEAMSASQRIIVSERTGANIAVLAPAMKISEFEFTSASEGFSRRRGRGEDQRGREDGL